MSKLPPSPDARERARQRPKPAWIDREAYPFASNYADVGPGSVHYVDEGRGSPVVFLHGNPTWSFLYRDLIKGLAGEYRCIAPDLLGFGLSDRPRPWSYRVRDHAAVIRSLLEELDLSDATLVLHDWGGPIGLDYATRNPDAVDSLVVLNSAAWPLTDSLRRRVLSRGAGSPIARLLNRRYNVPVDWLMASAFGDEERWGERSREHYREPMSDPVDRLAALRFVQELVDATPFLADLWRRRERIAGTPALICWGLDGPVFDVHDLGRWQALLPDARTVGFPDVGHFVQEERPAELRSEVRQFLGTRGSHPEPSRVASGTD